jgi:hypothetical protein
MITQRIGLLLSCVSIFAMSLIHGLFAQDAVHCPAPPAESEICRTINLDIQKNILMNSLLQAGKGNDPAGAISARRSLEELSVLAFSCGIITSCDVMSVKKDTDLGSGWVEKVDMNSFSSSFPEGQGCSFSTEIKVVNGATTFRGFISRSTGRLSYTLPTSRCAPAELAVERRLTVSEFGMLFVDYSDHVDAFPGSWLLMKKKRTPQFSLQSNGNMRLLMSDGHYFEVDANAGRIVASDMIDPVMFDPAQCRSIIRNEGTRTYTDVKLLPAASNRIGARFTDFGGSKTEREIEAYIATLKRQPL